MKNITLATRQAESLKELMNRGLAYTDMLYKYSKRMENIYIKLLINNFKIKRKRKRGFEEYLL